MRIFATLLSVVLLSIPGASLFSQDMMMDGTGFYVAAGGGATLITDTCHGHPAEVNRVP